jgi:hypothetical protein
MGLDPESDDGGDHEHDPQNDQNDAAVHGSSFPRRR